MGNGIGAGINGLGSAVGSGLGGIGAGVGAGLGGIGASVGAGLGALGLNVGQGQLNPDEHIDLVIISGLTETFFDFTGQQGAGFSVPGLNLGGGAPGQGKSLFNSISYCCFVVTPFHECKPTLS